MSIWAWPDNGKCGQTRLKRLLKINSKHDTPTLPLLSIFEGFSPWSCWSHIEHYRSKLAVVSLCKSVWWEAKKIKLKCEYNDVFCLFWVISYSSAMLKLSLCRLNHLIQDFVKALYSTYHLIVMSILLIFFCRHSGN